MAADPEIEVVQGWRLQRAHGELQKQTWPGVCWGESMTSLTACLSAHEYRLPSSLEDKSTTDIGCFSELTLSYKVFKASNSKVNMKLKNQGMYNTRRLSPAIAITLLTYKPLTNDNGPRLLHSLKQMR